MAEQFAHELKVVVTAIVPVMVVILPLVYFSGWQYDTAGPTSRVIVMTLLCVPIGIVVFCMIALGVLDLFGVPW